METFVVRIWTPGETGIEPGETLRGLVEHVTTATSAPFTGAEDLIRLLRTGVAIGRPAPTTREGSER